MNNSILNLPGLMLIIFCVLGCGNKTLDDKIVKDDEAIKYFPVEAFFLQQIKTSDSMAIEIYKLSDSNGSKDSIPLSRAQLKELSKNFMEIGLSDSANKIKYTESSFLDLATNSYTFIYKAKEISWPIRDITILVDTLSTQVKRVFINKIISNADSTISEKLGWKNNAAFFINRTISIPGKAERTELITVAWQIPQ